MQDVGPGRHASDGVHRRRRRSRRVDRFVWFFGKVGSPARVISGIVVVVIVAAIGMGAAIFGVATDLSAGEPTFWGTYTQHRCVPDGNDCDSYGTGVSDDGRLVKTNVEFQGTVGGGGTARASFTPRGFAADDGTVDPPDSAGVEYWLPWVFVGSAGVFVFGRARGWSIFRRRNRHRPWPDRQVF